MLRGSPIVCAVMLAAVVSIGQGGVDLGHGIELDALVGTTAHFYRFTSAGLYSNEMVIERAVALAGLTGRVSSVVSIRAYFDIGSYWGGPALDMYTDFAWPNGMELRVGQFLLPLGMEAMTEFGRQKLANSSFLVGYAKPAGTRDIGVMGTWQRRRFSVAAALVNGAGTNTWDNNVQKDMCVRLTLGPLAALDAVIALRGYYGRPDASDSVWRSAAIEARLKRGPNSRISTARMRGTTPRICRLPSVPVCWSLPVVSIWYCPRGSSWSGW
jgi:hypothetical protein